MELFEFLMLWGGTIVTSFGMNTSLTLKIFKDIADSGYKIDKERLFDVTKQLRESGQIQRLSMLVPGYNLAKAFQAAIEYKNAGPLVIDQFHVLGVLEEMTDKEKEMYQKKPTGLNALAVPFKTEIQEKLKEDVLCSVEINSGNEEGKIYYNYNEETQEITVIKGTGTFKNSSQEELEAKLMETIQEVIAKAFLEKLKEEENIAKQIAEEVREKKLAEEVSKIISEEIFAEDEKPKSKVEDSKEDRKKVKKIERHNSQIDQSEDKPVVRKIK